ncbi:hypothetical protein BDN70DRAFT_335553 [Pholiota conissans]|uniref:Uncharacterized protein n=1 Tax=Pholiota conissans TaxID=109636 RepID=A0A9P5YRM8_9AGAR|nr:hypothetical protein BDN70DRAFT_335553 [Pholiota conissans]
MYIKLSTVHDIQRLRTADDIQSPRTADSAIQLRATKTSFGRGWMSTGKRARAEDHGDNERRRMDEGGQARMDGQGQWASGNGQVLLHSSIPSRLRCFSRFVISLPSLRFCGLPSVSDVLHPRRAVAEQFTSTDERRMDEGVGGYQATMLEGG